MAEVTVLSNGTCIDSDQLLRLRPYVDRVAVSFDGFSEASPAYIRGEQRFAELRSAVLMIKEASIPAHIIATLHAKNMADIGDYLELADKLGVTINFSLLSCVQAEGLFKDLVFEEEDLRMLGRMMASNGANGCTAIADSPLDGPFLTVRRNCGLASGCLSVTSDGTLYPCHMLHDKQFALGNVFYGAETCAAVRLAGEGCCDRDATTFEKCARCDYVYFCGGGCRARAYYATGAIDGLDPYCSMMKAYFDGIGKRLSSIRAGSE